MLDLSHIPNSQQDVQVFYSNGVTNAWQTWNKPRKCNYVWIMCIGGGAGGAGGTNGTSPQQNTGGASGGVSRALYNAQQLPDTLYVQVGLGGAGGNQGSNGSAGTRSIVTLQPSVIAQNIVAISGNVAAVGGSVGAAANSAGETAASQATATFYTLSNFISTAGQTSLFSAGSAFTALALTSQITTSGGNGDASNNPFGGGTSILSSSISPLIQGGALATASGSNGGNGANGITSWKPFYSLGGAGGGAATSGSGGNGGNGGIGSGGGGAGNGNVSLGYTSGRGGKGGDGLVVIISF